MENYAINLDGSLDSTKALKDTHFPKNDADFRCVVAVDAVSIAGNIKISYDGVVSGLIKDVKISEERIRKALEDDYEYSRLVSEYGNDVIRYCFVFYICPPIEGAKPFPVAIVPGRNGNADEEVTKLFDSYINIITSAGMEPIGITFDGDKGWISRAKDQTDKICTKILNDLIAGHIVA